MSTLNICFCREIRKILCGYALLSGAVILVLKFEEVHFDAYSYVLTNPDEWQRV